MVLKDIAVSGLEKTMNHVLKLDPDYTDLLKPLLDKTIKLVINFPPITLYFQVSDDRVQCLHCYYGEPDCTIQGSSIEFITLALSKESAKEFFSSQASISGNTETAQQFADLCKNLDLDWEECIAKCCGDTIAHTAGNFMRNAASWHMKTASTFKQNLSEFIHDEISLLPRRADVELYLDSVDHLRNDFERLSARLQQLQSIINQQET